MAERIRRPLVLLALGAMATSGGFALTGSPRVARASSPTPQLPDLVADPPDTISLEVSEETPTHLHTAAKLLLRFDGYVHNVGPGPLDFRGSREAPPNPSEPAVPKMNVFQRIYEYELTAGPPPPIESTPYENRQSNATLEYVSADGHKHWHLQHVAYYSLWNAEKTAEVAPAQKVGFCLEDSQHVEPEKGPATPVYSDNVAPYRHFCQQEKPEATSLFEGISPGWRDLYESSLAFQWVDISNVLPGKYWLREDIDPEHLIQQAPEPKPPAYAQEETIVPGFDAQPQVTSTPSGQPLAVTLSSRRWEGSGELEKPSVTPSYEIVTPPQHGILGAISGNTIAYVPVAGYSGPDSFTFAARDPNSHFPASPAVASVLIDVNSPAPAQPSVAISGAPTSMIAGTSVQLSATVSNDPPGVTWSATAGSITSGGRYTAPHTPPAGGLVTIVAQAAGGAHDQRAIQILPVPPSHAKPRAPTVLDQPGAMLIGRKLYMSVVAREAGRLRLTALLHGRPIASCAARVRRHQSFTCAARLPRGVSRNAPIGVLATLRVGHRIIQTKRRPAQVPTAMKAMNASHEISWSSAALAARFFCGI
jgi:Lysyl oxidase/Bacterial Ig domain